MTDKLKNLITKMHFAVARLPWVGKYFHPYVGRVFIMDGREVTITAYDGNTATMGKWRDPPDDDMDTEFSGKILGLEPDND